MSVTNGETTIDIVSSNIKANSVDQQYCNLLKDILAKGVKKADRTLTGTTSVFGRQLRFDMSDGFPLLTSKKMYVRGIIVELLWFLGKHMTISGGAKYKHLGRTNIRYLLDNQCNIWTGDVYKRYLKEVKPGEGATDDWCLTHGTSGIARYHTKEEFSELIKSDDDFAKKWGDLGPVYGKQWRSWGESKRVYPVVEVLCTPVDTLDELHDTLLVKDTCTVEKPQHSISHVTGGIDQIAKLIQELKDNPDSRRLMVTAWNPDDLDESVLPPCHYGFQCYTSLLTDHERYAYMEATDPDAYKFMRDRMWVRDGMFKEFMDLMGVPKRKLSLMWNQRSVDTPLGLPFNIASYGFLLHMLADRVDMIPGELIANLGDTHIYDNQWIGVSKQLGHPTYPLPKLTLSKGFDYNDISDFSIYDFKLEGYQHADSVYYPLSN